MVKTAILTGSKRGLGQWLKEFLEEFNYEVIEFNYSDGNDITESSVQSEILETAKMAHVFINNAHSGYAQCQLLSSVFSQWQDTPKHIINIGCSQFSPSIWNLVEYSYVAEKAALHALVSRLQQQPRQCKITVIQPGVLQTPNTSKMNMNKVSKEDFKNTFELLFKVSEHTEIRSFCIDSIEPL